MFPVTYKINLCPVDVTVTMSSANVSEVEERTLFFLRVFLDRLKMHFTSIFKDVFSLFMTQIYTY